jgi:O-antigen/teichoic acid export membrane protein
LIAYDFPLAIRTLRDPADDSQSTESPKYITESIIPSWHPAKFWAMLKIGIPMGLSMMLATLASSVPVLFVENYLSKREVAIFAAAAYLLMVQTILMSSLTQAVLSRIARHFVNNERRQLILLLVKLSALSCVCGLVGVAVAWFAGELLLTTIYSRDYAGHADILQIMMFAAITQNIATVVGSALTAAHRIRIQLGIFSIVLAATFLSSYFLVPTYGLHGAAVSYIVLGVSQFLATIPVLIYAIMHLKTTNIIVS